MVPTVVEQSKEQEDFNLIKKKFNVKDESFEQGIIFAQLVSYAPQSPSQSQLPQAQERAFLQAS